MIPDKTKAAGWHHAASKNILKIDIISKPSTGQTENNALHPNVLAYYKAELKLLSVSSSNVWAMALCPFHDDKIPSLSVNVKHGGFKCFSCGCAGGDILHFHAKKYELTLENARQYLMSWKDGVK